jgi:cytochrome d ubiquinol oxidase subunit II
VSNVTFHLFWGAGVIVFPVVLIYTAVAYWIFRGKVGKVAPA